MKTVNDTFKALQGYTYIEISDILHKEYLDQEVISTFLYYCMAPIEVASPTNIETLTKRNEILEKHNWTHHQYLRRFYGIDQ